MEQEAECLIEFMPWLAVTPVSTSLLLDEISTTLLNREFGVVLFTTSSSSSSSSSSLAHNVSSLSSANLEDVTLLLQRVGEVSTLSVTMCCCVDFCWKRSSTGATVASIGCDSIRITSSSPSSSSTSFGGCT